MADWEWKIVGEESSKSIALPSVLPPNATIYGGRYVYDDEEPVTRYTFRGIGVPKTQVDIIRTSFRLRKTKYNLTDKLGDEHSGYVTGYRFENIDGCDRYNVDLEMTIVTTELGGA